jgi:hypothetical protein
MILAARSEKFGLNYEFPIFLLVYGYHSFDQLFGMFAYLPG